jgi:hypothetical protein
MRTKADVDECEIIYGQRAGWIKEKSQGRLVEQNRASHVE